MSRAAVVDAFLTASIEGRTARAARLLHTDPKIARHDIATAAVLGEAARANALIEADPKVATAPDDRRQWPPLLYVCHSRWHRIEPDRAAGMTEVARLLLDAGADPNTTNGLPARHGYRSALYGAAGIADNPAITRLLLERGADPNDNESLYHSAAHDDLACLRLLVEHGAREPGTNALANILHRDSLEGVRLLLAAGADPGRPQPNGPPCDGLLADLSIAALPAAVSMCSAGVVEELLAAGADPDALCRDGRSPIRAAARRGHFEVVEVLLRHGAHDDMIDVDRFLGVCARADQVAAERLLAERPGLLDELTDDDFAAIVDAADYVGSAAVRLMLDLGFPVDARRPSDGAQALHAAAYTGRADLVRLLIERGADVNARDRQWHGTPLAWATVGSGERPRYSPYGDWVITVEALFEAGAAPEEAWVEGKPPSEEVIALLYARGVVGAEAHEV